MNKEAATKRKVSVLEVVLAKKSHPELVVEPCHSSKCPLRIPECQDKDGLGHMMGNPDVAICYLKRQPVEIADNGATHP